MNMDAIVTAILSARDFCGNEREAALAECIEQNIPLSPDTWDNIWNTAIHKANAEWRESQKAAGVKPKYYR